MINKDIILFKNKEFKNKIVPDSFQAFLVDGASFSLNEEYPIIPSDFVSKCIPEQIIPFEKAKSLSDEQLKNTTICFYEKDSTFEVVRRNPDKYISLLKKSAGIVGLDFSIHTDMPIIKQKSQMNDNLSLTYYFGMQGIPVIPNIRYGVDSLRMCFYLVFQYTQLYLLEPMASIK